MAQGPEDAGIDPHLAQQAAAFEVHQGLVFDDRERTDAVPAWFGADQGALPVAPEGIEDAQGDILFQQRDDGLGVQNGRPEIGQLVGLPVRKLVDALGPGHQFGVGGIDPVYMGVVLQFIGIQKIGQQRGRIVAAVAAQGRGLTLEGGADKPGCHRHGPGREGCKKAAHVVARHLFQHLGIAEGRIGFDQFARVDQAGLNAAPLQKAGKEAGRDQLPVRQHLVFDLQAVIAQQAHAFEQSRQFCEGLAQVHVGKDVPLVFFKTGQGSFVVLAGRGEPEHFFELVGGLIAGRQYHHDALPGFYLPGNDFKHPLDALPVGQGFAPKLEHLEGPRRVRGAEDGLQQLFHLLEFDQKGIVPVHRADLPVGHVAAGLGELLVGFLVFGGGKEQVRIDPDDVDVRIALLQQPEGLFPAPGDVDGLEQLVGELVGGQLEALLQFLAVVQQPALHVEQLRFLVGAPLEALLERFRGAVAKHGVHARIVHGLLGIHQELLLDLAVGDEPVSRFPVRSHRDEVLGQAGPQGRHFPGDAPAQGTPDQGEQGRDAEVFQAHQEDLGDIGRHEILVILDQETVVPVSRHVKAQHGVKGRVDALARANQ